MRECTSCQNQIENNAPFLQCPLGHAIEGECLNHQIQSLEFISTLNSDGVCCLYEDQWKIKCPHHHLWPAIEGILTSEQLNQIRYRLSQNEGPVDPAFFHFEVQRLSKGIEEAFNLCCPIDGCGETLDQIEGCNAATCSNPQCKTLFCYLCLRPQKATPPQTDKQLVHKHVVGHSGDFWERRPGFQDRYHLLMARAYLANLFKGKVHPQIREKVLENKEQFLKEKKLWPLPSGLNVKSWLNLVEKDQNLSVPMKIELLQNEFIFRKTHNDHQNAAHVARAIQHYGGLVLASLDVKDSEGIDLAAYNLQREHQLEGDVNLDGADGDNAAVAPALALVPVDPQDPRVGPLFAALGEMYEIPGLGILSGSSPLEMNWSKAMGNHGFLHLRKGPGYCQGLHPRARLLNDEEWEVVARSMGKGTRGGYNPRFIEGMANHDFWSSDYNDFFMDPSFLNPRSFHGSTGEVRSNVIYGTSYVRCIIPFN